MESLSVSAVCCIRAGHVQSHTLIESTPPPKKSKGIDWLAGRPRNDSHSGGQGPGSVTGRPQNTSFLSASSLKQLSKGKPALARSPPLNQGWEISILSNRYKTSFSLQCAVQRIFAPDPGTQSCHRDFKIEKLGIALWRSTLYAPRTSIRKRTGSDSRPFGQRTRFGCNAAGSQRSGSSLRLGPP